MIVIKNARQRKFIDRMKSVGAKEKFASDICIGINQETYALSMIDLYIEDFKSMKEMIPFINCDWSVLDRICNPTDDTESTIPTRSYFTAILIGDKNGVTTKTIPIDQGGGLTKFIESNPIESWNKAPYIAFVGVHMKGDTDDYVTHVFVIGQDDDREYKKFITSI